LPPASYHQEPVELLQQSFRVSIFIFQLFTLRTPNLSLDTIFMEAMKKLLCTFAQIQTMKLIGERFSQSHLAARLLRYGPDLDVLPFPLVKISLHMQQHRIQIVRTID